MARAFTYEEFVLFVEEYFDLKGCTEKELETWFNFYHQGRASTRWDSSETSLPNKYAAQLSGEKVGAWEKCPKTGEMTWEVA